MFEQETLSPTEPLNLETHPSNDPQGTDGQHYTYLHMAHGFLAMFIYFICLRIHVLGHFQHHRRNVSSDSQVTVNAYVRKTRDVKSSGLGVICWVVKLNDSSAETTLLS